MNRRIEVGSRPKCLNRMLTHCRGHVANERVRLGGLDGSVIGDRIVLSARGSEHNIDWLINGVGHRDEHPRRRWSGLVASNRLEAAVAHVEAFSKSFPRANAGMGTVHEVGQVRRTHTRHVTRPTLGRLPVCNVRAVRSTNLRRIRTFLLRGRRGVASVSVQHQLHGSGRGGDFVAHIPPPLRSRLLATSDPPDRATPGARDIPTGHLVLTLRATVAAQPAPPL